MAKRKIEQRNLSILEQLVYDSLHFIGLQDASKNHAALLLRLIFSGIGKHFFFEPDTEFQVGFIKIKKSPDKDQLFNVDIVRSEEDDVINAETLWKYYTGELFREKQLKEVLDKFVEELVLYSQEQEMDISNMTSRLSIEKAEKEKK